jgi:hypothetical protein
MRYEYETRWQLLPDDATECLQNMGAQGWRVLLIEGRGEGFARKYDIFFERATDDPQAYEYNSMTWMTISQLGGMMQGFGASGWTIVMQHLTPGCNPEYPSFDVLLMRPKPRN